MFDAGSVYSIFQFPNFQISRFVGCQWLVVVTYGPLTTSGILHFAWKVVSRWKKFAVPPLGGVRPPKGGTTNFLASKSVVCCLLELSTKDLSSRWCVMRKTASLNFRTPDNLFVESYITYEPLTKSGILHFAWKVVSRWKKFAVPPLGGVRPPKGGTTNFLASKKL